MLLMMRIYGLTSPSNPFSKVCSNSSLRSSDYELKNDRPSLEKKFSGKKLVSFPVQSGMKKLGSTIYLIIKMIGFLVPSMLTGIPDQANERVHG